MEIHDCVGLKMRTAALTALLITVLSPLAEAKPLTLEDVEKIALQSDPSVLRVTANRDALTERAVAAGELPDPMLKLGLSALPTDSFNLGQEPMTQVQLGVVQKFPRGNSRKLRSVQLNQRSEALDAVAQDQRLRILRAVREEYLEVLMQKKLAGINDEAIAAFADLAEIAQDYYATGRVQQQDVLRASVELAKVRDRATRISQQEDQARARLAAWIGESAFRDISANWPDLELMPTEGELLGYLEYHPRIRALHQNVIAAETGVELAKENYKPEFALDLTYGGRGGRNPDGRNRPDLLSMMVVMDVPLFTGKRQDRLVAASIAESSAAAFGRDDVFRQMQSQVAIHSANLRREKERLELYRETLLPEADFNAEATFEAYQAAVADLPTLMRARITEFELELEFARLQAETRKTQSRLLYLAGGVK